MRVLDARGRLFGAINVVDVVAGCVVLSITPTAWFVYRSIVEHGTLAIERVSPGQVTVGGPRVTVSIFGLGFDQASTVQFKHSAPIPAQLVNAARLDVHVPPTVEQGWQSVCVRNSRGRYIVKRRMLLVMWQPVVQEIAAEPAALASTTLTILGTHFEPEAQVWLDGEQLTAVKRVDATRLEVSLPRALSPARAYRVIVRNPQSYTEALWTGRLVVEPPPVSELQPAAVSAFPPVPRPAAHGVTRPALVTAVGVFPWPADPAKLNRLRREAVGIDSRDGVVVTKILDDVRAIPSVTPMQLNVNRVLVKEHPAHGVLVANVLLAVTEHQDRDRRRYFIGEQEMIAGASLLLRVQALDTLMYLASDPVPVAPALERPLWKWLHANPQLR